MIRERTLAGLQAARARGRTGGRPPALEPKDIAAAKALLKEFGAPVSNGVAIFKPSEAKDAAAEVKTDDDPLFASYRNVPWLARTHAVTLVPSAAALQTLRGARPRAAACALRCIRARPRRGQLRRVNRL